MSEFTDLLLQVFTTEQALLFIGLAAVDYVQLRWFRKEIETVASLGTEHQRALADGGEPVEEDDDV